MNHRQNDSSSRGALRVAWVLLVPALFVLAPLAAQAITIEDVVGLTRAQASDSIILSKIQADGTVFQLTVSEILDLKEAGVSDVVITFMINTGKNTEPDLAVEADPEPTDLSRDLERMQAEPEYTGDEYAAGGYVDPAYQGGAGGLSVGVGVGTGGIGLYFGYDSGYYYPSWPGYYYSYYYDPFYWGGWGGYYAWCSPYPYSAWYGGWCGGGGWGYWGYCGTPYPYYGYHHGYGYGSGYYADGRYSGSRGAAGRTRGDAATPGGSHESVRAGRDTYRGQPGGTDLYASADGRKPTAARDGSYRARNPVDGSSGRNLEPGYGSGRPVVGTESVARKPSKDGYRSPRTVGNTGRTPVYNNGGARQPTRGYQPGTQTGSTRTPSRSGAVRQPSRTTRTSPVRPGSVRTPKRTPTSGSVKKPSRSGTVRQPTRNPAKAPARNKVAKPPTRTTRPSAPAYKGSPARGGSRSAAPSRGSSSGGSSRGSTRGGGSRSRGG